MADVADLACSLPGTRTACAVADLAQAGAGAAAGGVLDGIADAFAQAFGDVLKAALTFWTRAGSENTDATAVAVGALRGDLAWLVAFLATASLLVAATRLALTRNSAPAVDAARTLVTVVVVWGAGVPAVAALWTAGDAYSRWVLDRAGGDELGGRLLALVSALSGNDPIVGAAGVVLLAGVGILLAFGQVVLMVVRVGALTLLSGVLPLLAAGTGTKTGQQSFARATAWVLAFVIYKPTAATVYAAAFWLVGEGEDLTAVLSGLALLLLSLAALPALLRLVTPAVSAVASSGGGGGGLAAAGLVAATGARAVGSRAPAASSASGARPSAGSSSQPSGARGTGSTSRPTSSGASPAPTPAGAAAGAGVALAQGARQSATRAVDGGQQ